MLEEGKPKESTELDDFLGDLGTNKNAKTSFGIADDEEEKEEDLFIVADDSPEMTFEPDLEAKVEKKGRSLSDEFEKVDMLVTENPFVDTLANSESIPTTKKLDTPVVIEDNYISKSTH